MAVHPEVAKRFYNKDPDHPLQPVPCPLDEAALCLLRERMPTRKSHASIRVSVQLHSLLKSRSSGVAQLMKALPLQNAVERLTMQAEMGKLLPGFKLCSKKPLPLCDHHNEGQASHVAEEPPADDMRVLALPSSVPSEVSLVGPVPLPDPQHVHPSLVSNPRPLVRQTNHKAPVGVEAMADLLLQRPSTKGAKLHATPPKTSSKAGAKRAKPVSMKRPAAAVPQGPVSKAIKLIFPGTPKKPVEPMSHGNWRVYTDLDKSTWRCKKVGARKDTGCSWKKDPEAAWHKVLKTISQK